MAVLKKIPLDGVMDRFKNIVSKTCGYEVTVNLDRTWWWDFLTWGIERVLFGESDFDELCYTSMPEELEMIGFVPEDAKAFMAAWENYLSEYFKRFALTQGVVDGEEVSFSLINPAVRSRDVGDGLTIESDANLQVWILIGPRPEDASEISKHI